MQRQPAGFDDPRNVRLPVRRVALSKHTLQGTFANYLGFALPFFTGSL
jgi:hypothetical protein